MRIYYIIMFLIIILSILSNKRKNINIYDFLIVIILSIFAGARYFVGTDYELYYRLYNDIGTKGPIQAIVNNKVEFGYSLFNYITYKVFGEGKGIFYVTSFFIICIMILFIKNNSKNFVVSIIFFYCFSFFTNSLNIQRQYMAASICILSMTLLFKEKNIKSLVLIFIAFLFHRTSLIMLLPYIILRNKNYKITKRMYFFMYAIGILGMVYYEKMMSIIASIFNKYELYNNVAKSGGIGTFLMVGIFVLFSIVLLKLDENKYCEKILFYKKIFILGIPFYLISLKSYLIMRIAMVYFSIYMLVLIPEILMIFKRKFRIVAYYLFIISMNVWFYFYLINQNGVVPYKTI